MEEKKSNSASFEGKSTTSETINRAPKKINNTPFHAVETAPNCWKIVCGMYIISNDEYSDFEAAVKGFKKHKWEILMNLMSLTAGIQIQNAITNLAEKKHDTGEKK